MLEIKKLTKRFGDFTAIDNISFTVNDGEVVGFLGPNGAGKSTTMKIVTGYLAPTSGTAIIDGKDIQDFSDETRAKIGYLPERNPLYDELQVKEYLSFVAELRGVEKKKRSQKIDEMIEICGLQKMLYRSIGDLSKGFRQRVGLAQSLIHDPDIVVMDEPTSGLDPNQIIEIRELIKEIGKTKTVILSTHILPEVQETCNRMIIINEGKIVAQGTTEELTKADKQKENVIVSLKCEDKETIAQELRHLPYVEKVEEHERAEQGTERFRIVGSHDMREDIFKLSHKHNWPIMEMFREQVSLEKVFRNLTQDSSKEPTEKK